MTITPGSVLFLDTNILIYALTEHPRFGRWCDDLLTRISRGEVCLLYTSDAADE